MGPVSHKGIAPTDTQQPERPLWMGLRKSARD
jgi:hypothetical protein